jgi:uncharacterized protein YdhG (YjbR/CyaY superfamily)
MKTKQTTKRRKGAPRKTRKAKTPDVFLAALPDDKRVALESLRKTIKAAVPEAEECISYGLPAFRLGGKFLVAYGAASAHCAFYPGAALQALGLQLRNYDTSKGTIRFPANKPLPAALVRKILKLRIARIRG